MHGLHDVGVANLCQLYSDAGGLMYNTYNIIIIFVTLYATDV